VTARLDRLRRLDACAQSDALDEFPLPGAIVGLAPRTVGGKVAGRVMTVNQIRPNRSYGEITRGSHHAATEAGRSRAV
jgi:4-hydroxy-4-methyl-2-oxoglutarate aldolase